MPREFCAGLRETLSPKAAEVPAFAELAKAYERPEPVRPVAQQPRKRSNGAEENDASGPWVLPE
jgi:hypothetical protein